MENLRGRDGRCDGHGRFTYPDGQIFEGEWRDGRRNGSGKLSMEEFFHDQVTEDTADVRNILRWLPGPRNVADGLTKYLAVQDLLIAVMQSGLLDRTSSRSEDRKRLQVLALVKAGQDNDLKKNK